MSARRFTDGGQRALVLLLCIQILAGCNRDLFCRTVKTVSAVKVAVGMAVPFLAPNLVEEYGLLSAAADAAMGPLIDGCTGEKAGLDAAASAIALLGWYRDHAAEISEAAGKNKARGVRAPGIDAGELEDVLGALKQYVQEEHARQWKHAGWH